MGDVVSISTRGWWKLGIAHLHFQKMVLGTWDALIATETSPPWWRKALTAHPIGIHRAGWKNKWSYRFSRVKCGRWTPTGEIPVSKIPLEPPEGLILCPLLDIFQYSMFCVNKPWHNLFHRFQEWLSHFPLHISGPALKNFGKLDVLWFIHGCSTDGCAVRVRR